MIISDALINVAIGVSFVPCIMGLVVFRKLNYGIAAIAVLAIISVVADMCSLYFSSQEQGEIIIRTFSFLEFVLVSVFFHSVAKRAFFKRIILFVIVLFPLIVVGDAVLSQEKNLRDDPVTVFESIIFVVYSVIILYLMMKDIEYKSVTSTPQFWVVSAVLVYFGGGIFVFSSSNYASSISRNAYDFVWGTHAAILILYHLIITTAFWKIRKQYR